MQTPIRPLSASFFSPFTVANLIPAPNPLNNRALRCNTFIYPNALRVQGGGFLEKALHEEKEPFLLHRKGELIGWGTNDVRNLIEAANAAVINEETKSRKLTYDEYFKIIIHDWFEIFVNEGITEKVVKHLNARIQHVRFHHVLKYSENFLS